MFLLNAVVIVVADSEYIVYVCVISFSKIFCQHIECVVFLIVMFVKGLSVLSSSLSVFIINRIFALAPTQIENLAANYYRNKPEIIPIYHQVKIIYRKNFFMIFLACYFLFCYFMKKIGSIL